MEKNLKLEKQSICNNQDLYQNFVNLTNFHINPELQPGRVAQSVGHLTRK